VIIPSGLAAELVLLAQALDLPDFTLVEFLSRLVADSQAAVDSYLGVSVSIAAHRSHFDLTVLDEDSIPDDIRASVLVPLSAAVNDSTIATSVALTLYAGAPGAFIDLAADLSWITGRPLTDFQLDAHRTPPSSFPTAEIAATSSINQALGVLIGRGRTPEQAERDLSARAVTAGIDLLGTASLILASIKSPVPETGHQ
jgi:hypothetical protein